MRNDQKIITEFVPLWKDNPKQTATFSNVRRHFTSGQILKDQPKFLQNKKANKNNPTRHK